MTASRAFAMRHPVSTYYTVTFAISWGGILLVVGGPGGIPGDPEQFGNLLPALIVAMLAGPTIAGLLCTGLFSGRTGFRDLVSRMLRWSVGIRWYAVALLVAPLLMTVIPSALSIRFPEFLPRLFTADDKASILRMGVMAGLMAGIFEEIGWTGFALPGLRQRFNIFTTGLFMGILWGAWHFLVNFWSSGSSSGTLSLPLLLHSLIFSVGILTAYRVLMVWVYDRTGSLLIVVLMHLSLTASNVIFVPQAITGTTGPVWSLVLAAGFWIVVALVVRAGECQLSQQSFRSG